MLAKLPTKAYPGNSKINSANNLSPGSLVIYCPDALLTVDI